MKTIVKKTFLDIQKEEEWLNEQGKNGLMLLNYNKGEYEFENVTPAKYQYKIDLPNYTGDKKKAYLDFLEESGISVVSKYAGRVYLRKNMDEGPLELYSDKNEISKQVRKKYMHFFLIGVQQFVFGLVMLILTICNVKERGLPFIFTVAVEIALIISGIIFFVMGIMKHRKYSVRDNESDIWE